MPSQLSRRAFFAHASRLVVLVPAGWTLVAACGSSSSGECNGADTVMSTGAAIVVISTCNGLGGGHTHDFTVQNTDLATPPAAGVSGNSSPYDDDGHTHTVSLTQADLQNIQNGQTVTKQSGTTNSHMHTFDFKKA